MRYSFNIRQAFIIKFILILFLLNPINTVDAKMEAHLTEQVSTKKIKKNTLFKKFKPKKERKKWKDLSYGEKSFRLAICVLIGIPLSFITFGFTIILSIILAFISIRLGLRSLKEKETGSDRKKRNQGIAVSLITLVVAILIVGLLVVIFGSLF